MGAAAAQDAPRVHEGVTTGRQPVCFDDGAELMLTAPASSRMRYRAGRGIEPDEESR